MRAVCASWFAVLTFLVLLTRTGSFLFKSPTFHRSHLMTKSLSMKDSQTQAPPPMHIVARGMDLTDSMNYRAQRSIGNVLHKLGQGIISTHVVLRIHKYPITESHTHTTKKDSQIAEVTVNFRGGAVIHASEHTDNMSASIDLVAHKLAGMIKKHNDKLHRKRRRDSLSAVEGSVEEVEQEDDGTVEREILNEMEQPYRAIAIESTITLNKPLELVRPKAFDMPPINMDEALAAFSLIDHPFYVFRNQESNEINVLYRRKDGGVGLIMPQSPSQT